MNLSNSVATIVAVLLLCFPCLLASDFVLAEQDEQVQALAAVQGKWQRTMVTPNGPLTVVKEHKDNTSTVRVSDAQGNLLREHHSEFKLEYTGKVRTLTFFNQQLTVPNLGPGKQTPSTYVYRVSKDNFYEIYGLLEADPLAFEVIVWERVK